jgi:vesicle coat complex subunit
VLLTDVSVLCRWGQIAILTALADYKVTSTKEAENVCERIVPRLQHANGAVVLSVVKVRLINDFLLELAPSNSVSVLGSYDQHAISQGQEYDSNAL